jgi:hypothetical protein
MPDEHDRIANAIQAVGGWSFLCRSQASDIPSIRAAFRNAYRAQAQRKQIEQKHNNVLRLLHGPKKMVGE